MVVISLCFSNEEQDDVPDQEEDVEEELEDVEEEQEDAGDEDMEGHGRHSVCSCRRAARGGRVACGVRAARGGKAACGGRAGIVHTGFNDPDVGNPLPAFTPTSPSGLLSVSMCS